MENPEIDPNINGNSLYDKDDISNQWYFLNGLFNKWFLENWLAISGGKVHPYLTLFTKDVLDVSDI